MHVVDALRAKLDEDPFKGKREPDPSCGSEFVGALRVARENMAKGRRLGLMEALELLGCDRAEESAAFHLRRHQAACTSTSCPVCTPDSTRDSG